MTEPASPNPAKLSVDDLQAHLLRRGLDTSGTRLELVVRLRDAIAAQPPKPSPDPSPTPAPQQQPTPAPANTAAAPATKNAAGAPPAETASGDATAGARDRPDAVKAEEAGSNGSGRAKDPAEVAAALAEEIAKRKKRAERFKVEYKPTLELTQRMQKADEKKKEVRSQRFSAKNRTAKAQETASEKEKKTDEAKAAPAPEDPAEAERRRKRAERFGGADMKPASDPATKRPRQ